MKTILKVFLLSVAGIVVLWFAMPPHAQVVTNFLTKQLLQSATQTFNIAGIFDFDTGKLKIDRGSCPPSSTLCDAADGTEEGQLYQCNDSSLVYTCRDDSTGWEIAGGVRHYSWHSGYGWDTLSASGGTGSNLVQDRLYCDSMSLDGNFQIDAVALITAL
jgi:hypothetical protein